MKNANWKKILFIYFIIIPLNISYYQSNSSFRDLNKHSNAVVGRGSSMIDLDG